MLGDVKIDSKIWLRMVLLIRDLLIDPAGEVVINISEPRAIKVTYRRPDSNELERGSEWEPPLSLGNTICLASGEWNVSNRNCEAFEKLAKEGADLNQRVVVFGNVPGTGMPAWDALPQGLQDLLQGAEADLGRAAGRSFRLLRWYLALPGDHAPFRLWSFEWSPDGSCWQALPRKVPLTIASVVPTLRPIPWFAETIEKATRRQRL